MVGRNLRRCTAGISGFCFESIFPPVRLVRNERVIGAFNDDFVPFLCNAAECSVSVHQMEAVLAVVHELIPGAQIQERLNAQKNRSAGNDKEQSIH